MFLNIFFSVLFLNKTLSPCFWLSTKHWFPKTTELNLCSSEPFGLREGVVGILVFFETWRPTQNHGFFPPKFLKWSEVLTTVPFRAVWSKPVGTAQRSSYCGHVWPIAGSHRRFQYWHAKDFQGPTIPFWRRPQLHVASTSAVGRYLYRASIWLDGFWHIHLFDLGRSRFRFHGQLGCLERVHGKVFWQFNCWFPSSRGRGPTIATTVSLALPGRARAHWSFPNCSEKRCGCFRSDLSTVFVSWVLTFSLCFISTSTTTTFAEILQRTAFS